MFFYNGVRISGSGFNYIARCWSFIPVRCRPLANQQTPLPIHDNWANVNINIYTVAETVKQCSVLLITFRIGGLKHRVEICTVKLASSVSPFKVGQIPTITYSKLVSRMINMFSINSVKLHSVFLVKNTFYYSQDQFFCWNLTWRNLEAKDLQNQLSNLMQTGLLLSLAFFLNIFPINSLKSLLKTYYPHYNRFKNQKIVPFGLI